MRLPWCFHEQMKFTPGCANLPAIGRTMEVTIDCKVVWGYEDVWVE